jgi:N-acetylglutamate synthase-like GNAT family acetyltransferase
MQVKKVTLRDIGGTYCCMGETAASWADFLPQSRKWFKQNLRKHVDGYHLLDGEKVVGHIYFAPSEKAIAPFEMEPNIAFIYCTEMLHDYMRKGYGRMMFDYAKNDLRGRGFKGILVDASEFEGYMHHSYFTKQGFKVIEEHTPFRLMYFPLLKEKVEAKPLKLNYQPSKDRVELTLFKHSFCPVAVYMYSLVKSVARSFGEKVRVVEIEPTVKTVRQYGTTNPLINGKVKVLGPASEQDVRKAIQEEIDQFRV